MKNNNTFRVIAVTWFVASIVVSIVLVKKDQSALEIFIQGFLLFALCILAPVAAMIIIYIIISLFSKEGREMLTERAQDSERERRIKRVRKHKRNSGFSKAFFGGLGFGAGWSMFNDGDHDGIS